MKTKLNKSILTAGIGISMMALFSNASIAQPPMHGDSRGMHHKAPNTAAILARMDANVDTLVTLEDLLDQSAARAANQFSKLDDNSDQLLTVEELAAHRPHQTDIRIDYDLLQECIADTTGQTLTEHPTPEDAFFLANLNNDAYLDYSEFLNAKAVHAIFRFEKLDQTIDGIITEEEIALQMTERQTMHAARKDCKEEQLMLHDADI